MPRVTTGNTMAPCVVIGERAAEILRRRHGLGVNEMNVGIRMSRTTDVSGLVNAVTGAASQPVFSVVGTLLQFISPPEQNRGNLSVMIGGIPARAVIPLHSHSDPEVFYVLEGSMEVFQDDGI